LELIVTAATMSRVPLLPSGLLRAVLAEVAALTSYYLLLAATPLFLARTGAGAAGVGVVSAALLGATLVSEAMSARLLARTGAVPVAATGLILMTVSSIAAALPGPLVMVAVIAGGRGFGFGLVVVACAALAAGAVPQERRGAGLGLYGVLSGLPAVVAVPLGVGLTATAGYVVTSVVAAGSAAIGLLALVRLPASVRSTGGDGTAVAVPVRSGRRARANSGVCSPCLLLAVTTMAGGVVVTFLPLAWAGRSGSGTSVALGVHLAAALVGRWAAGVRMDRSGLRGLVVLALVVATGGLALLPLSVVPSAADALALAPAAVTILIAMLLSGLGFGALQTITLSALLEQAGPAGYGRGSARWNLAYDSGLAVGVVLFGAVVCWSGYCAAFGLIAILVGASIGPTWRAQRRLSGPAAL
jgi:MFS family permease